MFVRLAMSSRLISSLSSSSSIGGWISNETKIEKRITRSAIRLIGVFGLVGSRVTVFDNNLAIFDFDSSTTQLLFKRIFSITIERIADKFNLAFLAIIKQRRRSDSSSIVSNNVANVRTCLVSGRKLITICANKRNRFGSIILTINSSSISRSLFHDDRDI
ncbi:hypothetical protein DERP_013111 [Dermatophagoides pteronyssinus]|uniref:Uncharacterized protein n=1 Tax=Dermatophagoides pteronyssinus TaxID=6956 RepID=A0ABQ8J5T7_DERPT|nr:hypothetical protein DERP_013111 [Dermatophagoides pteronyssinus]